MIFSWLITTKSLDWNWQKFIRSSTSLALVTFSFGPIFNSLVLFPKSSSSRVRLVIVWGGKRLIWRTRHTRLEWIDLSRLSWYAIRVQIKLPALIRIKFHSEHTLSRIKKEKSKHVRKNNTSVHCSWRYDKSRSIRLYNVQAREDARKILLNSRRSKERKRERKKKGGGRKIYVVKWRYIVAVGSELLPV